MSTTTKEAGLRGWTGPLRRHLGNVEPYASARREARAGLRLDANENALGSVVGDELHRYPDPAGGPLRAALSGYLDVEPERLWLGSGADDVIDVLVRTLVEPRQPMVATTPSYDMYRQRGAAHGALVRQVRLDDEFDLDTEKVVRAANDAPLVMLCSPNNPTGNLLSRDRILALLERTEAVVAVDEAYVEFALSDRSPADDDARPGDGARPGDASPGDAPSGGEPPSLASLAGTPGAERLVVVRTLSKAWGLAGLRAGYLVGAPSLVRLLDVVGLPYRLTTPAIRLGTRALGTLDDMRRRRDRILAERDRVAEELRSLGLRVLPSAANFLLFFVVDAAGVQERLAREHDVLIRRRDGLPGLDGALRVTIGTPNDNDRFLAGLERTLG